MEAEAPNNGGSKASDFQPPTGNPQTAPAQLFNQRSNLQMPTTQDVLRDQATEIVVPNNPAPPPAQIAEAKSSGWLIFGIVVLLAVLISLHFRRRWTIFTTTPKPATTPETKMSVVLTEAPVKNTKSTDPKKKAARKAAKKRKRTKR